VQERVAFARCDLLAAFVALPVFDLILSNPPYVRRGAIPGLSGIVRNYEPHLALDGGESGVEVYRGLISQAAVRLKPGGWLLLEIGDGQAQPVGQLLAAAGLALCEAVLDLQKIPRCLVARHNKN
jgi:release factor glutamine methyltransferase